MRGSAMLRKSAAAVLSAVKAAIRSISLHDAVKSAPVRFVNSFTNGMEELRAALDRKSVV